ncbi:MAG: Ig-like domain-containing protein, partial [Magnetococcus sp. WYHC-3]
GAGVRRGLWVLALCLAPTGSLPAMDAPLPRTGQSGCHLPAVSGGGVTYTEGAACNGTGQDGASQVGVPWPAPRFLSNGDGTITDRLTHLVWLQKADCFGAQNWTAAVNVANALAQGQCGLADGSVAGAWRLPNVVELETLLDAGRAYPALALGSVASGVQNTGYWSATTRASRSDHGWFVSLASGAVSGQAKSQPLQVWPVRDLPPGSVFPTNVAPVAANATLSVVEDSPVTAILEASDANDDTLTYRIATAPALGEVVLTQAASGQYRYTPDSQVSGTDSFTFVAGDGALESTPATVTVTITPVNDAPRALPGALTLSEDTPVNGTLAGSDEEGNNLTYAIVAQGSRGNVTLNASTGAFTYVPMPNVSGTDRFTFRVSDGQLNSSHSYVTLNILPFDDAPVAVAGSLNVTEDTTASGTLTGSDAEGSPLTFSVVSQGNGSVTLVNASTGEYTYTPAAHATGNDSFTFKANDGSQDSSPATVSVTIGAVNDAPEVNAGADVTVNETDLVVLNGTAVDIDGNITSYQWQQTGGTSVNLTASGTTAYFTAPLLANATVLTLTLTATDNAGTSTSDEVNVTVNPVPRTLSIADANITEGDNGTSNASLAISLNLPAMSAVTVVYATSGISAVAGVDYTPANFQVTVPAGSNGTTAFIEVWGDTLDEAAETLSVVLLTPSGATLADASANLTILDDDPEPTVSLFNSSQIVYEADKVTVPVGLSAVSSFAVSVPFTFSGTVSGADYTSNTTSPLTIAAGCTTASVHLTVLDDHPISDANETLILTLGNATYATLGNITSQTLTLREPPARTARTGQTASYASGDDGALQRGVAWPSPRFLDLGNGAVTDNLTGLVWLKDANCFGTPSWLVALSAANALASGSCGLSDGSVAGDWRMPNRKEMLSLFDYARSQPSLPAGHPFTNVSAYYWTSTTYAGDANAAWEIYPFNAVLVPYTKTGVDMLWPVRGGQ